MTRQFNLPRTLSLGLALSLALAAGISAAAPSASAQTGVRTRATIPFAFSADRQAMPAGTYIVEVRQPYVVSLTNATTNDCHFLMVRPDSSTANLAGSRLVFHRATGQTYLTQVWVRGKDLHSELTSRPRPEREVARREPPMTTFEVALY